MVTELSRWGRSTQDLFQALEDCMAGGWRPGSDGLSFDLSTARKLLRTIMASSSRDLIGRSCKSKAGQASARHNCRRAVLSADCPQRGHERATVMDIVKLSVGR